MFLTKWQDKEQSEQQQQQEAHQAVSLLYAMQVANHNPANPEQIIGIVLTNKGRMLMPSNQPLPQQTRTRAFCNHSGCSRKNWDQLVFCVRSFAD
ncbi:MAG: hypothetical protein ACXV74_06620 [Methylobacter sp.]